MKKLKKFIFTDGVSILGDEVETGTKSFSPDRGELAQFIDKRLDNYGDIPSQFYTGDVYSFF